MGYPAKGGGGDKKICENEEIIPSPETFFYFYPSLEEKNKKNIKIIIKKIKSTENIFSCFRPSLEGKK